MVRNRFFWLVFGICVFSLCAAPLFGQGTFTVTSSPVRGADIGAAELTGEINLTVLNGTTVAAPLMIQFSAPVTNNGAAEIQVRGTGGLAFIDAIPTLLSKADSILINVPAGGTAGDVIRILGVRVSLAGYSLPTVTAVVSSPTGSGNGLASGNYSVTVIDHKDQPLAMDVSEVPPLSFVRDHVTQGESAFVIMEGYVGAFSDKVGIFGQTVPTSIRITPYPEIPLGCSVTFRASVSSESGGTLTTSSGLDEVVPRADGSTEVIYEYMAGGSGNSIPQSFTIPVTLTLDSASETGVINFQAALVPIGITVPDGTYPNHDIPRYLERLVPDASDLPGMSGSVQMTFPFRAQSDATYTALALTNLLDAFVNVTLTPYDTNGAAIATPKTVAIAPKTQLAKLATDVDLFGPGFNASTAGTIVAVANAPVLTGFYLLGDFNGPRLDGARADMEPMPYWVWPVIFRQNPAPYTTLELFNPNPSAAATTLVLYDPNGTAVSTVTQDIAPSGTITQNIQQLFPQVDFGSFSGGYVKGLSSVPLLARETFGNSLDSNVLPGQMAETGNSLYWPHYVTGGGLTTELTFVNLDSTMSASITVVLFDNSGNSFGHASFSLPPSGQHIETIAHLFPDLSTSIVTTGYLRIDVESTHIGPFVFTPAITGALRFSLADGSGSAALPMTSPALTDFVYSHVVETSGYYTGIAMLNANLTPASVSFEVCTRDGKSVGKSPLTLQPGQKIAMLLHELVPAAAGQSGGYIHIQSDLPVLSFSMFGSNDGLSLSAIPPQNIGK